MRKVNLMVHESVVIEITLNRPEDITNNFAEEDVEMESTVRYR